MEYHSDRFEDFSMMIYRDDILYAVLPANKKGDTVYSHEGLTYGSFVLQKDAKLIYAFEAFRAMLQFLSSEGIPKLDIRVIPSFYTSLPSDELSYFLFKANAKLLKRDVIMVIDYREKLRFHRSRRQGIRRANKNGLQIKVDSNYKDFWNEILIPNLADKHGAAPVHSLDEIEKLAKQFPHNIKQVNVYKDDKIVAGTTVFITKTTIHPQYLSGDSDKNENGSIDMLYDFMINQFCEDMRYFDFNTSSEDNGLVLNGGLLFWKEGWGARTFTADNYVIDTEIGNSITINLK